MKNKKIIFMFVLILSAFGLIINVNAEVCSTSNDSCTTLSSKYNSGKTDKLKVTSGVVGNENVTVYGKSVCSTTSCVVDYSGFSTYEELLKNNVVCSGGEKYIKIQNGTGDADDFKKITDSSKNDTHYFSETYSVTCTGEVESGNVELSNGSSTKITSNSSTSTNTTVTNSGSGVENPGTGVETYYVVLAIAAIGAYLITLKVKKHNLFKNI